MGKNIRHRDEILRGFHHDAQTEAENEKQYTVMRDTYFLEILCDIRDNLHHIAQNIRDYGYESDIE